MARQLTVINTPKRNIITEDKREGIFNFGADNSYPQLIERIINGSVSARTSSDMLKKFLIGNGFEQDGLNASIIHSTHMGDVTLYDLLSQVAGSIAKHRGAYVQLQWNLNGKITSIKHIPFRDCRLGKSDSNGYSGKIHIYNNWDKSNGSFKANNIRKIDVFNPIAEVITTQLASEKWHGQIAYLYLDDEYVYPLATIDCVREDADTENQSSMFRNGEFRRGFNARIIIHSPNFDSIQAEADFKAAFEKSLGGDHETTAIIVPSEWDADGKLIADQNISITPIPNTYTNEVGNMYNETNANNIRKAHLAIPKILIDTNDSAIFGQSGDGFVQAFNFYNTQTKDWRVKISQYFAKIMKHHEKAELANANYNINPLTYIS